MLYKHCSAKSWSIKGVISSISVKILKHRAAKKIKIYSTLEGPKHLITFANIHFNFTIPKLLKAT